MKLKQSISMLLAMMLFLMLIAIASEITASTKNTTQTDKSQSRYQSYLLADEFRQTSMDLTRLCRTFVLTGDQQYWDQYWEIVKWRNGDIARPDHVDETLYRGQRKKQSDIMRELGFSDKELNYLQQASQNSNSLIATEDQAMKSIRDNRIAPGPHQARAGESPQQFASRIVFDTNYHNEVANIMAPVNQFFSALDTRTFGELQQSQQDAAFWLNLSFICQALVTVIGLLMGIFMLRALFVPLTSATTAMQAISHGSGDLTQRLDERGNNELSMLGLGFNLFTENIRSMIVELHNNIEKISSMSSQLTSTAQSTDQAIVEQKSAITQLSANIEQIVPAIKEVAANASQALQLATNADQAANRGLAIVDTAVANIGQLESNIDEASTVVSTLAQDTNNIGSVLDVIRGIADQTNLLALNAAIEAARAGEQGRGFAVVADEVRTLAKRTQDSTAEIQQMIEQLQQGAGSAVKVMEQSRSKTEECVGNTRDAGASLSDITSAVGAIAGINNQIATATEQQHYSILDISQHITNINNSIEHTSQGSQKTSDNSARTTELTEQLISSIARFKTQ